MSFFTPSFAKRSLTALILAPLVILLTVQAGWPFIALISLMLAVSLWEWGGMVFKLPEGIGRLLLFVAGIAYLCLAHFALVKLEVGFHYALVVTLFFMVWGSDTCAYLLGKAIGGPKLAPKISPNKTWAGLLGAVLGSALLGFAASYYLLPKTDFAALAGQPHLLIGAVLGLVGQAGDLMISAVKRKAGVKDASQIIPGHGGVLDRIDALLLVGLVYLAAIVVLTAG